MLYVSVEYLDELIASLRGFLPSHYGLLVPGGVPEPRREIQQGGKEVTYYVEVPVKDFSLCLGCFDLARHYLNVKAGEHCVIDPSSPLCRNPSSVVSDLKLRLKRSPTVKTFAKVGVAKISGKRPQIMVKLASEEPRITIRGVLKDRIEGKARGELVHCNHEVRRQYLALDLVGFYKALIAVKSYVDKLPREE